MGRALIAIKKSSNASGGLLLFYFCALCGPSAPSAFGCPIPGCAPDAASVTKKARKAVHQVQVGLSALRPIHANGELQAQVYGGTRSLFNPLTFAVVGIDRRQGGAGARLWLGRSLPCANGQPQGAFVALRPSQRPLQPSAPFPEQEPRSGLQTRRTTARFGVWQREASRRDVGRRCGQSGDNSEEQRQQRSEV